MYNFDIFAGNGFNENNNEKTQNTAKVSDF